MTIEAVLNDRERYYFFARSIGHASGDGYIGSETWRGFTSIPSEKNAPSSALKDAYYYLEARLWEFVEANASPSRSAFDDFHAGEVESLYQRLRQHRNGIIVQAIANGSFHDLAYNAYAKVVNLAHTHACFRPHPVTGVVKYPPSEFTELRRSLHVPLDVKVLDAIRSLIENRLLPSYPVPTGGMGSVKTQSDYLGLQQYLRNRADEIVSVNFPDNAVSPLAFDGFW